MKPELQRYIIVMFILGVIPVMWVFINSLDYFMAGMIYVAIAMVLLIIYFNGDKLK